MAYLEGTLNPAANIEGDVVDTAIARVWRRRDGILHVEIKPHVVIDEANSLALNDAIRTNWVRDDKLLMLTDISAPHQTTPGGRRSGTSPPIVEITKKLAILVRSPVARMIGNLFMRAKRPPYPTHLFTAEDDAVAWLLAD